MHDQKFKYVGELPTISHSLLCQPSAIQLTFQTPLSVNPLQARAISCNSYYIAMYLNTVMLSLLLGTAFMTVQLTTAQSPDSLQIQVNLYSDTDCADYVNTVNATTSCSPAPTNSYAFELVCQMPKDNCTAVTFYQNQENCTSTEPPNSECEGANCTSNETFITYQCPCNSSPSPRDACHFIQPALGWFKTRNLGNQINGCVYTSISA